DNVTFTQTVDSLNATARSLTVNSTGTTTFGGTVGTTFALSSLTTNAGGTTAINGGAVRTNAAQTYNDPWTLNADTTLDAAAGNVTFAQAVNSLNATARGLTVNSTGTTTFGGAVGTTFALSSLTTNAGGTTAINGGAVTTNAAAPGGQTYNDPV